MQEATDDEKSESVAETEEESGAKEGEESDQEGKAPGGHVVSEITTYGCQISVCCRRTGGGIGLGAHIREAARRDAP